MCECDSLLPHSLWGDCLNWYQKTEKRSMDQQTPPITPSPHHHPLNNHKFTAARLNKATPTRSMATPTTLMATPNPTRSSKRDGVIGGSRSLEDRRVSVTFFDRDHCTLTTLTTLPDLTPTDTSTTNDTVTRTSPPSQDCGPDQTVSSLSHPHTLTPHTPHTLTHTHTTHRCTTAPLQVTRCHTIPTHYLTTKGVSPQTPESQRSLTHPP